MMWALLLRRFRSMVPPRPGVVSIFADGSVIVTCAGAEMGQGMFTKVKQARIPEWSLPVPGSCAVMCACRVPIQGCTILSSVEGGWKLLMRLIPPAMHQHPCLGSCCVCGVPSPRASTRVQVLVSRSDDKEVWRCVRASA